MSMSPRPLTPPSFNTFFANKMAPAQVPYTAMPCLARARMAWSSLVSASNWDMVVLSPPGMTRPCTCARSSWFRTSAASTPSFFRVCRCSKKSPWSASTPTRFTLPASFLQPHIELGNLLALHGLAQALGDPRQDLGVLVVGYCQHDGLRHLLGVFGLENPRTHENSVAPQLHHQRGIRGSRDASGRKVHDQQPPGFPRPFHQFQGHPVIPRQLFQLVQAHVLQQVNLLVDRAHVPHRFHDVDLLKHM